VYFLLYLAINLGWVVTEVGRLTWIVYGLMKTTEAVNPITIGEIIFSLMTPHAAGAVWGVYPENQ